VAKLVSRLVFSNEENEYGCGASHGNGNSKSKPIDKDRCDGCRPAPFFAFNKVLFAFCQMFIVAQKGRVFVYSKGIQNEGIGIGIGIGVSLPKRKLGDTLSQSLVVGLLLFKNSSDLKVIQIVNI